MKKLLIGLVVVLAVIAAGVFYLASSLDDLVKTAIEKAGSKATGVPVTVASVKITASEGKGVVRGLTIGNPPGFSSPSAVRLGEVALVLDVGSLTKDPIVIRSIQVSAPEITYEMNKNGASNIQTIQKKIESANPGAGDNSSAKSDSSGPKVVVDRFDIVQGKVILATPVPGLAADAALGDIHLTNLGRQSNGLSYEQLASSILKPLLNGVVQAARSVNLGGAFKDVVNETELKDAVGGAAESLKNMIGK